MLPWAAPARDGGSRSGSVCGEIGSCTVGGVIGSGFCGAGAEIETATHEAAFMGGPEVLVPHG
jgi:hypothetical protein